MVIDFTMRSDNVHYQRRMTGYHCGAQNFDAIGGTADIGWPPAPIASEAYDPTRTWAANLAVMHNVQPVW